MLVDPFNFTKFDRTTEELEAMILFSVMVANKRADQTYAKLEALLGDYPYPFNWIEGLIARRSLLRELKRIRAGQYKRIAGAFRGVLALDLRTCTIEDLEAVKGIGPKTARMFLMHSRPKQRLACLDTHVLAYLRQRGVDAPRTTPPSGRKYRQLEEAYLALCDAEGVDPTERDSEIWNERTVSRISA